MKNDRKLFNLGLQILCPKDPLVLVLSPLGGSGDETDWDLVERGRKGLGMRF